MDCRKGLHNYLNSGGLKNLADKYFVDADSLQKISVKIVSYYQNLYETINEEIAKLQGDESAVAKVKLAKLESERKDIISRFNRDCVFLCEKTTSAKELMDNGGFKYSEKKPTKNEQDGLYYYKDNDGKLCGRGYLYATNFDRCGIALVRDSVDRTFYYIDAKFSRISDKYALANIFDKDSVAVVKDIKDGYFYYINRDFEKVSKGFKRIQSNVRNQRFIPVQDEDDLYYFLEKHNGFKKVGDGYKKVQPFEYLECSKGFFSFVQNEDGLWNILNEDMRKLIGGSSDYDDVRLTSRLIKFNTSKASYGSDECFYEDSSLYKFLMGYGELKDVHDKNFLDIDSIMSIFQYVQVYFQNKINNGINEQQKLALRSKYNEVCVYLVKKISNMCLKSRFGRFFDNNTCQTDDNFKVMTDEDREEFIKRRDFALDGRTSWTTPQTGLDWQII